MLIDHGQCRLCPRECGARRAFGERGICGADSTVRIARAAPHFWEEPFLSNKSGSGAVFFTGCSLGCVYCQNRAIAGGCCGIAVTERDLSLTYLSLQKQGVHNINLVTAGHYLPTVADSLRLARLNGLTIPVVYNTSSYEKPEAISLLSGLVDIYLPDFKYYYSETSLRYSSAPDYPDVAKAVIAEMVRQAPAIVLEDGILVKGTVIRLLLLPDRLIEAKAALRYLYTTYGDGVFYSLMRQYTPMEDIGEKYPELARRVSDREYFSFVSYARSLGIRNAFVQESESVGESFIPSFDGFGVVREGDV